MDGYHCCLYHASRCVRKRNGSHESCCMQSVRFSRILSRIATHDDNLTLIYTTDNLQLASICNYASYHLLMNRK